MNVRKCALVACAGLVVSAAWADVYPVTSPQQITTVMASAKPGDTLTMANGTWTNVLIAFAGHGDSLNPIVLRAETPGQVLVTGASNLRISGSWLIVEGLRFEDGLSPSGAVVEFRGTLGEAQHCRLTGTSVVNFNPPDINTDYKWVSLYGANNRVDHCYLANKTHSGTTLVIWLGPQPNYHRIDHNYFGPRPALGFNGGETIRVGTSDWSMYDSYTIVEDNYFYQCNGEVEIISSKSCENIYRRNTFVSCAGALTLRHGNRCTVEGNFFFGNKVGDSGGIRVIGEDHVVVNNYMADLIGSSTKSALPIMNGVPDSPLNRYFQVQRAIIAHNTIVDCTYPITIGVGKSTELSLPPRDCLIGNNIIRGTRSPLITIVDNPIDFVWQANIFSGGSLGITQPPGITLTDPLLVKGADGLWRPGASSPAIDSASGSYPMAQYDMDGQVRTGLRDIGADEVSDDPIASRPLAPEDVGPGWMVVQTSVPSDGSAVPVSIVLEQNYPNPFNPSTRIRFAVTTSQHVVLSIHDVSGRRIAELINGLVPPGLHDATFTASGLSSGIYYARLMTETGMLSRSMILLK